MKAIWKILDWWFQEKPISKADAIPKPPAWVAAGPEGTVRLRDERGEFLIRHAPIG